MKKLLLCVLLLLLPSCAARPAWAVHYYVDNSGSDNCNDGLSPATPWRTIAKVNAANLNSGDIVSFRSGQIFTGTITLVSGDSGLATQPVTLNSYDPNSATPTAASISSGAGIGLNAYEVTGVTVQNLKFFGTGSPQGTNGVQFFCDLDVGCSDIVIDRVEVFAYGGAGGIIGHWQTTTTPIATAGYHRVTVTNSLFHDNTGDGFNVYARFPYANTVVYFGNDKFYNNSGFANSGNPVGSGVVIGGTTGGTIELSEAYNNGTLNNNPSGPVGIWAYDSKSIVIQNNNSHDNHSAVSDGAGFDFDQNTSDSLMQNNISSHNDGAGYLFSHAPANLEWHDNRALNNSSTDDATVRQGAIELFAGVRNLTLSGNTITKSSGTSPRADVAATFLSSSGQCIDTVSFTGNTFVTTGPDLINIAPTPLACAARLSFLGNSYTGTPFRIVWGSTVYTSCGAWHTGTGQETCVSPPPAPTVTSATPNFGAQGTTPTIAIVGTGFVSGATCSFGVNIVVTSCTFNSVTSLTAVLQIGASAALGGRTLTVTNPDAQSGSLANAFTVTAGALPAPVVTSVTPGNGAQGDTVSGVIIAGANFQASPTCSFGSGITVNSCTFNSSTQLTASITIAGGAPLGGHTVTVTNTDLQSGSLANSFIVTAIVLPPPTVTSATPNVGTQGQTLDVVIAGANFQSSATCSFGANVTVNSCTFDSSTQLTANITIAGGAATGGRTVTVTNPDSQVGMLANAFTITVAPPPAPTVTSIVPTTGTQGQTLSIAITGTGFITGATCSFGASVTTNSCTFNSSTSLTANITIAGGAATGGRTLTVTNPDSQVGTLVNAFTITVAPPPAPTVTSATPNTGAQGATLSVVIAGTGFLASPTCSFGANITINTCTRDSTIQITANITIAGGAATGGRTVTVTNTDTQTGSLANAFTVTGAAPPAPTVTSLSPNTGAQGATLSFVTVTGTGFQSGAVVTFSGTGVTVTSSVFSSATQIFVSLSIAGGAATTARDVTVTNPDTQFGTGVAKFTVTAVVNPAPTVTSVTPSGGNQGATVSTAIVGTGFLASPTCSFGSGITINTCVRNSSTSITSSVTIDAAAASGGRTVTVTNTDAQFGSLANGFTVIVLPPAPTVTSATPNSGAQGATLTAVLIAGTGFQSGAVCSFGAGITVNSCTFNSGTSLTANITIAGGATLGARTVTVTNPDTQSGSAVGAFTVTAIVLPAPTVTSVTPASGNQGATITSDVIVGTGFQSGLTCSYGVGITVNICTFNSATQATANITISASAASGSRTVTVTNPDAQSGSLTAGFTVLAPPPPPTVTSITPNSGAQGSTLTAAIIAGTNFQSGATCSFGVGIVVNSCTFNSATQLTANISISASATLGVRTVTVTNPDAQSGSAVAAFSVTAIILPPPSLTSISPTSGIQGQTLNVGIVGLGFQSSATCNFGSGITVNSCTFNSGTSLTANITIAAAAAAGGRTVTVTNPDAQSGTLPNAFTVVGAPPAPTVTLATPNSGQQGATLSVVIAGTNFQSGAVVSFSGTGITVNSTTFTSATSLTTNITIAGGATTSARNVTVTNPDAQSGSATGAFTVTAFVAPAPTVTSVSPISGVQGATVSIAIVGTGFLASPTCSFGSGITINTCVRNSATSITSSITIAVSATTGVRTVIITNTDAQSGSLVNGFTVTGGTFPPPFINTITPNTGGQGQTLTSVVIAGTGFQSGATCSFGAGITVNSCTFNSATQLTANITIAGGATVGDRTVVVTNPDTQSCSFALGFTVTASTAPAPTVTTVIPGTGIQGQTVTGILITGTGFVSGATCDFGSGITTNTCVFNSTTQLTASVAIASGAVIGARVVTVTNPDAQSGSKAAAFTVTAPSAEQVSWVSNSASAEDGFNLYRSDADATYALVGATGKNVLTLRDSSIPLDRSFCYKVSAFTIAGGESARIGGTGTSCRLPITAQPRQLAIGANAGSGTSATDSSGNSLTGTWNGGWTAHASYGSSLDFTSAGNFLQITGLTTYSIQRTWSMWANRSGAGGGSLGRLFDKHNAGVESELLYFDTSNIRFVRVFSTTVGSWFVPAPSLSVWHHIAVSYDSSNVANVPRMWIDGVEQVVSVTTQPVGTLVNNTDAYYFGNRGTADRNWAGQIDEIRVDNRLKSTFEIQTDMATALP